MSVNWLVKLRIAEAKIVAARLTGRVCSDDQLYREEGFRDGAHFWSVALSETMEAMRFVSLIADYFHTAWKSNDHELKRIGLKNAIRDAWAAGEPWVFQQRSLADNSDRGLNSLMVKADGAVAWIASKPLRRHLLPQGLLDYLDPADQVRAPSPGKRRTGPWPEVKERVKDQMRRLTSAELERRTRRRIR